MSVEPEVIGKMEAACYDCGLPYTDDGFCDLVVPHEVWKKSISPTGDGGGLLCPTCMVRAARKAGVTTTATFRSGPFVADDTVEGVAEALDRSGLA